MLVMAAEPITIQVTRSIPRTGNLPAGNGCFTLRTVASTAARKLRPFCRNSQLRRRRFAAKASVRVKRK